MTKRDRTQEKLEQLRQLASSPQGELTKPLQQALSLKNNFVVAQAAQIAGEQLIYDLVPNLLSAYDYFIHQSWEKDRTCAAKRAIARALYDLDFDDTDFYEAGIRYQQHEPVWGGSVDTAVDLRCTCALGLAASSDTLAVMSLLELLVDPEAQARIGAIKALALIQPREADIILRQKIFQGDEEIEVMAEAFAAILAVNYHEPVTIIGRFFYHDNEDLRAQAALCLGESRLTQALDVLLNSAQQLTPLDPFQRFVFRALAMHRDEKAIEFLLDQIDEVNPQAAVDAVTALAMYHYKDELCEKVGKKMENIANPLICRAYSENWEAVQR